MRRGLTASKRLRFGIVGTGLWAETAHMPALRPATGVQVVSLCGRTESKTRALAKRLKIPAAYTDLRKMLRREGLDALIVCTPNVAHYSQVMAALDAGVNVLCEKPLGMNLRECQRMWRRAEQRGLIHAVNFGWRFIPALLRMKELITKGYLGDPWHLSVVYFLDFSFWHHPTNWRYREREAGTGSLGDIGSHLIDLTRWLIGDFRRVTGHLKRFEESLPIPGSGQRAPVENDDACAFLAELEGGVQASFHMSRRATRRALYLRLELYGGEGALLFEQDISRPDWIVGSLHGARGKARRLKPLSLPPALIRGIDTGSAKRALRTFQERCPNITSRFVEAVQNGREMEPNFRDGMKVEAVLEAVERGFKGAKWVAPRPC